jgi:hypothetical protein
VSQCKDNRKSDYLRRPKSTPTNRPLRLNAIAWTGVPVALYRVHFVDLGGNVYLTRELAHHDDDDTIEAARRPPAVIADYSRNTEKCRWL